MPVTSIVTDVGDDFDNGLPNGYSLSQNYPNPFNPTTRISFELPTRSHVRLEIFNSLGQKVATLLDTEQPAGSHSVEWDGTTAQGNRVPTGIYLYRLTANGHSESRKMVLLK
jgi:hypothetical protein